MNNAERKHTGWTILPAILILGIWTGVWSMLVVDFDPVISGFTTWIQNYTLHSMSLSVGSLSVGLKHVL